MDGGRSGSGEPPEPGWEGRGGPGCVRAVGGKKKEKKRREDRERKF